jgi:hypothetical protein
LEESPGFVVILHMDVANTSLRNGSKPADLASELEKASDWLKSNLRAGPKRATEVEQEAVAAGISGRTLKRAKKKVGVHSEKKGDGWNWRL